MFAWIVTIGEWIWNGIQVGIDAIVVALQFAARVLKTGLLGAWSAVRFTWSDIIRPLGQILDDAYHGLEGLYKNVIRQALDWLTRVTRAVRSVYNTILRPIVNTFERLRQITQLLELLHVPFAAKLDRELADLERRIITPLRLVIQEFNHLVNRVESYVLTVENLFQRVTHLGSIARDLNAIQNFHWRAWAQSLSPTWTATPNPPAQLKSTTDHVALFDAVVAGDDEGSGLNVTGSLALFDQVVQAPS